MSLPLHRSYTHRMPGCSPPPSVVRRLARFHPTVKLVWNTQAHCWQLIERGDDMLWRSVRLLRRMLPPQGPKGRITFVPEQPTLENTVFWLDRHDVRRHQNEYELQRWLNKVDGLSDKAQEEQRDKARDAEDRIREGADRHHGVLGKRLALVPNPSDPED